MKIWISILFFMMSLHISGQSTDYWEVNLTLPQIALLDIEPNNATIELEADVPNNPGGELNTGEGIDNSKWINYTSTSTLSSPTKNVIMEIIQGQVPSGMEVRVNASNHSGSKGAGTFGTSVGTIILSNSPQTIISDIGGAYTGNKKNNGHNLTFSLHIVNYELMNELEDSNILLVSYTLMDN